MADQISESELTDLIIQRVRARKEDSQAFTSNQIYQDIKSTLQSRGYESAILYRVTEAIWAMVSTGMLVPYNIPVSSNIDRTNTRIDHWEIRLTTYGKSLLAQHGQGNFYYDPESYVAALRSASPDVDQVILQYAAEAMKCYRQGLIFAAAVMNGAAAEKAVLLLFESILEAATDPNIRKGLQKPMSGTARMPTIFKQIEAITTKFNTQIEDHDPKATEAIRHHMLSLADMIRRQRNDAVHPMAGRVEASEVFLSMTSFPIALQVIYRVRSYFIKNNEALTIQIA